MTKLLDDWSQGDRGEEGQSTNDQDDPDHESDEHPVVGSECPEGLRYDVLRGQGAAQGETGDDDREASEEHVDRPDDVVERRVAGESSEGRTVVVALRGESVEDLGESVRAGVLRTDATGGE